MVYGVARFETAKINCDVMSNPSVGLRFHWVFNTSQEMIDIQQDQMRVNGSISTVDYIPRTVLDYGTLLCWAENDIGSQVTPCVFHLVPALPPPPVSGCSFSHHDISSIGVSCVMQSRSSSKNVTFILELWRTEEDDTVVRNLTSTSGNWNLDGLEPGQEYRVTVFTSNIAGVSHRYNTSFQTYQSEYAESRIHIDSTNISHNFVITPILGALIGVGVALSFVTITILIVVCCKVNRSADRQKKDYLESKSASAGEETEQLAPDVVPSVIIDEDYSEYGPTYSTSSKTSVGVINNRLSGNLRPVEQTSGQHIYTLVCALFCKHHKIFRWNLSGWSKYKLRPWKFSIWWVVTTTTGQAVIVKSVKWSVFIYIQKRHFVRKFYTTCQIMLNLPKSAVWFNLQILYMEETFWILFLKLFWTKTYKHLIHTCMNMNGTVYMIESFHGV